MNRALAQIASWRHGPIALLIALFVVAQFVLASVHSFPTTRYESDGIRYMERASGALFEADPYHGPGYSLAIRLARGLTGLSPFRAAQLVSILAGMLLVYSAYRVFSVSDGHRTALRAVALTALTPTILQYSGMVLSDVLAAALMWATVWILTKAEHLEIRQLFLAGLLAGFAYLTRFVFIFLVLVPPLLLLLNRRWNKRALFALLGFYAGFFLVTAPWSAFLWRAEGNPFWNLNHLNVAFKMYRDTQGWNAFPSVEQFPTLGSVVLSDPALFVGSWFQTLLEIPLAAMKRVPYVGVVLGAVGMLLWFADFSAPKRTVAVALAGYSLLAALVWIEPRFLIPLIPFVALGVSRAIDAIPERAFLHLPRSRLVSRWRVPLRFPMTVAILVGIASASWGLPAWFRDRRADEYVTVVEWLKAGHANRETTVMVAKPHIPFFSGTTRVGYRDHGLQAVEASDLGRTLAQIRPDYFVYDERYASVEFPQFRHLLEADDRTEHLRPVLTVETPMRVVVFSYTANEATEPGDPTPRDGNP